MTWGKHVDDEHSASEGEAAVLEALDWDPTAAADSLATPTRILPVQPTEQPARKAKQKPPPRKRRREYSRNPETGEIAPVCTPEELRRMEQELELRRRMQRSVQPDDRHSD
jgi:hypothetical protein